MDLQTKAPEAVAHFVLWPCSGYGRLHEESGSEVYVLQPILSAKDASSELLSQKTRISCEIGRKFTHELVVESL